MHRAEGRRNVLSMFLQVAETLCQHLSLLDSKTKKKRKKEETNREYGTDEVCLRKGSRGGGKMDEEVEKD